MSAGKWIWSNQEYLNGGREVDMRYAVATNHPYELVRCKTIIEAKQTQKEFRKKGRYVSIVVCNNSGCDYLAEGKG